MIAGAILLVKRLGQQRQTSPSVRIVIRRAILTIERRGLAVALAPSELVGFGDGASAGCVIVVAALEAPTVVAGLDDIAVMGESPD